MDRLDAARALLGVSPASSSTEPSSPGQSRLCTARVSFVGAQPITARTFQPTTAQSQPTQTQSPAEESQEPPRVPAARVTFDKPLFQLAPPAVISNGLDALAALASSEQASWLQQQQQQRSTVSTSSNTSSDDDEDDSEAMPPPPPRLVEGGRRRSVSNPEGMEKWARPSRRHFVLPASILEEELAEASAAMEAHERKNSVDQQEEEEAEKNPSAPISGLMSEEEQANLTPDELLRRARSRLLEDLSEGNLAGEKGVLTLPHSLSKYKEVYNKNGRIGIYTPAERAAIIARFNQKRSRRVWNKKIRYNCRKNLADRRMRVKGRFVKRSTEQQARAEEEAAASNIKDDETSERSDEDMPDVTDPEAGFCPTDDQPYRRTRRHTIT